MNPSTFFAKTLGSFSISRIPFLNRFSLRTKLVFSFLFFVLAGGILSYQIGIQLVTDTIILQAQNKVKHDLNTAWLVYNESLNRIQDVVQVTALGRTAIFYYHSVGGPPPQTLALDTFRQHLQCIRRHGLDPDRDRAGDGDGPHGPGGPRLR